MKHLVKPENSIPNVLKNEGKKETLANITTYKSKSLKEMSDFEVDIKSSIYNSKVIKEQLLSYQKGTCCYCESKIQDISFGDVEHYRPKKGYQQNKADKNLHKPGYFWLGYDWSNLMVSCEICNRSFKKNYFPLKKSSARLKSLKTLDVKEEEPLILNPYEVVYPEKHLEFIGEYESGKTEEGKATVRYCGLYREELNESRRDKLDSLNAMKNLIELTSGGKRNQALEIFKRQLKSRIEFGEFTLMIRYNFNEYLPEEYKLHL